MTSRGSPVNMPGYFAHSENIAGIRHDLVEHLGSVARLAETFAREFGAADFGYWAGPWHDLGKFHPDFQPYIADPDGCRGPDHSSAGTVHSSAICDWVSFLVAGHHGGLPDKTALKSRIRDKLSSPQIQIALDHARQVLSSLIPDVPLIERIPSFLTIVPSGGGVI